MNKIFLCAAASAILAAPFKSPGQAPPTNPGQPLVLFPAAPAEWTVDIVANANGNSAPATSGTFPLMKKIDITKVGDITRDVITWMSGSATERWFYAPIGILFVPSGKTGSPAFIRGNDLLMGGDFAMEFDASSFTWLKESLFKDNVTINGTKCSHYEGTVVVVKNEKIPGGFKQIPVSFHCEAWIDQKTLVPVAFYDGSKLGMFTFLQPPAGPLTPPPKIARAIAHYVAASEPLK